MADDPMAGERFLKVVGRRTASPRSTTMGLGKPPSAEARAAMTRMANYRTRVPKGVFIYFSHEEANRDWERWRMAAMEANSRVPR
ncbi:MAG TPA: hypothetical protein VFU02_13630 [Polyangiaceae bacterium]|nr:hypothetical protein [Polyangiaceae bacterium]